MGCQATQIHDYGRFDNPYCRAEIGECRYVNTRGEDRLVLDFCDIP